MPDDDTLRGRRSYRHRRGDHSLCRPERCEAAVLIAEAGGSGLRGVVRVSPQVEDGVVEAYRASLTAFGRLDSPAGQLTLMLAGQLVDGPHTASALATLSRELRAAYETAIRDADEPAADVIDGIFKSA